ncbi:Helix-turn-helix [uncultured archaeon]|nr:Helix-turn-helix [uncultured archaeon]
MSASRLLARNIAGEITLSEDPGSVIRKWREIFGVSQNALAKTLKMSPSVISDYESGRRKSPGTHFIARLVEALIKLDASGGGAVLKNLTPAKEPPAILDLKEFSKQITARKFIKAIGGQILTGKNYVDTPLHGYTVIDSIQAILTLSPKEFLRIYGSNADRALIFTEVSMGRSPMIAIKVTRPKPKLVILQGLKAKDVDKLAVRIAKIEGIPLVVTNARTKEELIKRLREAT